MSARIVAHDVAYVFPNGRKLFDHLSFSLDGARTALVGPNGIGKTCLARLLVGELEPTQGSIQRHVPLRLFAQRQDPPSVTVGEFLAQEDRWAGTREHLLQGVDPTALCPQLSGGQWMRARLAQALREEYLILDEPTNDLDRPGREAVLRYLRTHRSGLLLISHDRECLALCDEVLELSNVGLARFGGGWSNYLHERAQERERLATALDRSKRKRAAARAHQVEQRTRQEKRNRHGRDTARRGGVPRILLGGRKRQAEATTGKRALLTLERAEAAVNEANEALQQVKQDPVMYAALAGQAIPAQKLVAEARGFNVRQHDWVFARDLEFCWRGNLRLALLGANGSGKSTLLRALRGDSGLATRGELRRGALATLYIDQHCSLLDEDASVLDNVRGQSVGTESEIRSGLAQFLFAGEAVHRKARQLSGGERLRVALARGLLGTRKPQLLLLDEPTNNLDLANIEFLENLVRQYRGALVIVSHDRRFLENCGLNEEFSLG